MKLKIDIEYYNQVLRNKHPEEIIEWAVKLSESRVVTTSFGVYSAVLLSTFSRKDPNIRVIWCDTLFNTPETYEHSQFLKNALDLNIQRYLPLKSKEYIERTMGIPDISDPIHPEFTETVKLEPFRRAMAEHNPDIWFANIRVRQNSYRDSKDILSYSNDGILKVSPFYYWSDYDLDQYLEHNNLTKNETYVDPTKVLETKECGIHFE